MRRYEEFIGDAPEELNGFFAFLVVPPVPMFPEALHMRTVCGVVWCSTADQERTSQMLAPTAQWPKPLLSGVGPMPLPVLNSLFDGLYPPGPAMVLEGGFRRPSQQRVDRPAHPVRVAPALHVFDHAPVPDQRRGAPRGRKRDRVQLSQSQVGGSDRGGGSRPGKRGTKSRSGRRSYWDAVRPYSAPGGYVNFMMEEGSARVEATYGENYSRLQQVKAEVRPEEPVPRQPEHPAIGEMKPIVRPTSTTHCEDDAKAGVSAHPGNCGDDDPGAAQLAQFRCNVLRLAINVVRRTELRGQRFLILTACDGNGPETHLRRRTERRNGRGRRRRVRRRVSPSRAPL